MTVNKNMYKNTYFVLRKFLGAIKQLLQAAKAQIYHRHSYMLPLNSKMHVVKLDFFSAF